MRATPTVSVRISAKRYAQIKRACRAHGHSIAWFLNFVVDLYFQSPEGQQANPWLKAERQAGQQARELD